MYKSLWKALAAAGLLTLAAGCQSPSGSSSAATAPLTAVQAVTDQAGNYTFTWGPTGSTTTVALNAGVKPGAVGTTAIATSTAGTDVLTVPKSALPLAQRYYFTLTPTGGSPVTLAVRHLPLAGSVNFRDLGGFSTTNGKTTKWGVYFRSDALNSLTASDVAYLTASGITSVVDLRGTSESAAAGGADVPAAAAGFTYVAEPINSSGSTSATAAGLPSPPITETVMETLYHSYLDNFAPQYAGLFHTLAVQGPGTVFHCTMGKDRAGLASALLLLAAGVPDNLIVADYNLTEQYDTSLVANAVNQIVAMTAGTATPLTAAQVTAYYGMLFAAPEPVIEDSLNYIRTKYGSAAGYLQTAGGLTAADLAAVLSNFVQ